MRNLMFLISMLLVGSSVFAIDTDSLKQAMADSIARVKIEKAQAKNDSIAKVQNRVYRVPYGKDSLGVPIDTLVFYPGDVLNEDTPFSVYDSFTVVGNIKRNGVEETQFKVAGGIEFFLRNFKTRMDDKKNIILEKDSIFGDSDIPDVNMFGGYILAFLSSLVILCTGIWFFFFRK